VKQLPIVEKFECDGWINEVALEELTEASHREPVCAEFDDCSLVRV
jgi:hypothetical protein